jgi:P4 family phage/plasmid primase-like protien
MFLAPTVSSADPIADELKHQARLAAVARRPYPSADVLDFSAAKARLGLRPADEHTFDPEAVASDDNDDGFDGGDDAVHWDFSADPRYRLVGTCPLFLVAGLTARRKSTAATAPAVSAPVSDAAVIAPPKTLKEARAALAKADKAKASAVAKAAKAQDAADEATDVLAGLVAMKAPAKEVMVAEAKSKKLDKAAVRALDEVTRLDAELNEAATVAQQVESMENGKKQAGALPDNAAPQQRGRHLLKADKRLVADPDQMVFRRWNGVYFEEQEMKTLRYRLGELFEEQCPDRVGARTVDDAMRYAHDMMMLDQCLPPFPADKTLIQLSNAVLEIQNDGRIFVYDPDPSFGQTTMLNATFDWARSGIVKTKAKPWIYTPTWPGEDLEIGRFLREIAPNQRLFEHFALTLGSTLVTGRKPFQKAILLQGRSGAGKGTLIKLLEHVHPNNVALPMEDLRQPFALRETIGKTLITSNEVKYLVEEPFKQLTGGDKMRITIKNQDAVSVVFTGTVIMSSNVMPAFKDEDGSIARRIETLPFNNSYSKSKTKKAVAGWFQQVLSKPAELRGWLDFLLCGVSALGARNWEWPTDDEAPPEVQQRKAEVLEANDPLSTWIDEFDVQADLTVWTPKQEIYDHYCRVMSARAKSTRSKERVLDYDIFWKEMNDDRHGFNLKPNMRRGPKKIAAVNVKVEGVDSRSEK